MDNQDLLSAALDESGLSLGDMNAQVGDGSQPMQLLQSFNLPNNIRSPFETVFVNQSGSASSSMTVSTNSKLPQRLMFLKSGNSYIQLKDNKFVPQTVTAGDLNIKQQSTNSQPLMLPRVMPSVLNIMNMSSLNAKFGGGISLLNPVKKEEERDSPTQLQLPPSVPVIPPIDEAVIEEEDDIFQAETYSDYMPSKLKIGLRHPDPVVETSSLSSVSPPDVWYQPMIPEETIDEGKLSALQLEAIVYACQRHDTFLADGSRAGFLIGDGAGVGKGRTVAGIIYENYLLDRKKAIWLSVSNDLKYDAERDLRDIGAKRLNVYPLNKFKYGKITSKMNGGVKKGVIFATYSSLISESHSSSSKYQTRLKQLLHWCGEDFDGVIVFDECHRAKNLCPTGASKATKTGLTVLELQRRLPKARVVYASATGASEPKNMAYMVRLGLWGSGTSFPEFNDFMQTVEKRGVGAMELVAIDMKLRGMYIARQLSFAGVQFRIEEIPLEDSFTRLYNKCVHLWVDAKDRFEKALSLMEGDNHIKKAVLAQFWASHQRFFKYLCIASKVKHAVDLAREALKSGKSIVIGLQSTGEAKTLEQLEDSGGELTDFVSTAKAVFQSLLEKHFPAPNRKKTLRLLGLDTSFFDDLGITLKRNGNNDVVAVSQPGFGAGSSKLNDGTSNKKSDRAARKGARKKIKEAAKSKWSNDSNSDDSDDVQDDNESDFQPSGSEDEDDDEDYKSSASDDGSFESVDDDDIEPWDLYQSGKLIKDKKASLKRKKQTKKSGVAKKKRDMFKDISAEFMSEEAGNICEKMREDLLNRLEALSEKLPPNTLDELIDELGGSENVAEMTGRKGRVISNEAGNVQYESRSENDVSLEILNLTEKQRFMDGEKQIAIISEAASSGISLHADRRAKNKSRRVHITIELPWSADRAIQQFGRTHRSNQVTAPEYVFLISDLAGEQRFASIVAKRLESLGALTHGDRRATESRDLSKYNIDNKYGRTALEIVMKSIVVQEQPVVPTPAGYEGNFFKDARHGLMGVGLVTIEDQRFGLEKDYNSITKFLNRLLGLEVAIQNALFKYFSETLEFVIRQAKKLGRYDLGIMDLTSDIGKVEVLERKVFHRSLLTGVARIEIHKVAVERGMSWDEALQLLSQCNSQSEEGFYMTQSDHMVRKGVMLAVADTSPRSQTKHVFRIYKPNTGLQSKTETLTSLKEKGKKISSDEAKEMWTDIYNTAEAKCGHVLWFGSCRRINAKMPCDIGLRKRIYHILSGSVLSVWSTIEKAVPHIQSKLQLVRLKAKDNTRVMGTFIPQSAVEPLINILSQRE